MFILFYLFSSFFLLFFFFNPHKSKGGAGPLPDADFVIPLKSRHKGVIGKVLTEPDLGQLVYLPRFFKPLIFKVPLTHHRSFFYPSYCMRRGRTILTSARSVTRPASARPRKT